MKKNDLDCNHCGSNMVKSTSSEAKLRAKIIKWNRDGMFAVCKSCNGEVPIGVDLLKSIQSGFVFEVEAETEAKA